MTDFLQTLLQLSISDPSPIYLSLAFLAVALIALLGVAATNIYYPSHEKPLESDPQKERLMEEHSIVFRCKMLSKNEDDRVFWHQRLMVISEKFDQVQQNSRLVDRLF